MKKETKINELKNKGYDILNYIIYAYLFVIFTAYLIVFDDKYFNITITRYNIFVISSVIFLVLAAVTYIMINILNNNEKISKTNETKHNKSNVFGYLAQTIILIKIAKDFGTYSELLLDTFGKTTIIIVTAACIVTICIISILLKNEEILFLTINAELIIMHILILYRLSENQHPDFWDQILKNIILIVALIIIKLTGYIKPKKTEKKLISYPETWLGAFWVSNIFAAIIAKNTKHALLGDMGRRMGLFTITILVFLVVLIGARFKANTALYMILAVTTLWAHLVAILQLSGYDFMHLRDNLSKKTANVFISTFGNINIYASYIAVSMPVFVCIYIFAKKIWYRIVSAVIISSSGMAMMMSNSDSAYLGVGCAMILIFFLAYKDDKLTAYFEAIWFALLGNIILVLMNKQGITAYKKRGGFADLFDNFKLNIILLVAFAILIVASYRIYKFLGREISKVNKNKHIKIMVIFMAAGIIVLCALGIVFRLGIFKFNDKWGNYRGFIWRISGEIYADFPIENKIFGYGNESVLSLTTANYYEEMVKITHSTYDNCHNEILQFLLTTGLLGAISYVGLFACTITYILKNSKCDYLAYIPAAAILGYFAQAMVSVGQPITSPLYYIFMAIGIGYVRYLKECGREAI